jgi:hypothetical protein
LVFGAGTHTGQAVNRPRQLSSTTLLTVTEQSRRYNRKNQGTEVPEEGHPERPIFAGSWSAVTRTDMHEIICPHCSKAFKIDEAGYADILKQVRDGEFEQQLHERLELAEREKRNASRAGAPPRVASELQAAAAAKDAEIQGLKARLDAGEMAQQGWPWRRHWAR